MYLPCCKLDREKHGTDDAVGQYVGRFTLDGDEGRCREIRMHCNETLHCGSGNTILCKESSSLCHDNAGLLCPIQTIACSQPLLDHPLISVVVKANR